MLHSAGDDRAVCLPIRDAVSECERQPATLSRPERSTTATHSEGDGDGELIAIKCLCEWIYICLT